jgi:RND family efflux transporter MFP subunit
MTLRPLVHALLLSSLAVLAACESGTQPEAAKPTPPGAPVRAAAVESAAVANRVRAVGVLAPRDEVRLSFKVGGVVQRVFVDAGDRVRAGQILATLEQAEVNAAVRQAREAVQKAERDLERGRRLRADEVATEEQVQDLATAYNVARADLDAAAFNARFSRIAAPSDGVVQQRLAEENELVQGGQPVLVLGSTESGWIVRTSLSDRDIVRVHVGDTATVSFDAFPGKEFAGRVTQVASASDPVTGTFDVEIEVTANGERFVRGLVAKATLQLAEPEAEGDRTIVPVSALVEADGSRATVFVVDSSGRVARRKEVTVGPIVGDRVIIVSGLRDGDRVVTDGAAWLDDGEAIRIVEGQG